MNDEQKEAERARLERKLESTELGFTVAVGDELALRGEYSGDRFKERYPRLYNAAVLMLQDGVRPKKIAQILQIDIRTVNALAEKLEAAGAITPYREKTTAKMRAIVGLVLDELQEKALQGKLGTIDLGILIEKIELLDGRATSRHEIIVNGSDDDYARAVRAARVPARKVIDAEEIPTKTPAPQLMSGDTSQVNVKALSMPTNCNRTIENTGDHDR